MKSINILHLYPKEMNLYGDHGNILTLQKRCEWRGIHVDVLTHDIGNQLPPDIDIIFGGGGQDSGQNSIQSDLIKNKEILKNLVDSGIPCLVVCGLYQLFGHSFKTINSGTLEGLSIFDIETIGGNERLIGNIVLKSQEFGEIVGYENHSGKTYLLNNSRPLARVVLGTGNNGQDHQEGVRYKNAIGTYLHGPILPKNPAVADFLIQTAFQNKYGSHEQLIKLEDSVEQKAHITAKSRPR